MNYRQLYKSPKIRRPDRVTPPDGWQIVDMVDAVRDRRGRRAQFVAGRVRWSRLVIGGADFVRKVDETADDADAALAVAKAV